ncbi:hypothetical protein Lepto7376_0769 [[Leptolyngbya] sp. PCC 7376]|uniref:hypothetical protein n=1 Tax=[Leptolyngbya] sp. PCC 7376 TaxID=111781 RepID=UPI00029EFB25|nr:hypothetical protein [[Leptolyngbya] sp. PCC 7376]AFY37166.1 hypothetical protein Lepto7376_0769 [[Leptolyngbya] sp. PCC 7376]
MPASNEFKKALRSGDLPEAFVMAMGKATELNITTKVVKADGSVVEDYDPAQCLETRLDILNGTIENLVGEEFVGNGKYIELQEFHQQQVALGNRKIQENFQSLQELFRLLVTLQQYNRLTNAEQPLDLTFLEAPRYQLPPEKVITTLQEQVSILETIQEKSTTTTVRTETPPVATPESKSELEVAPTTLEQVPSTTHESVVATSPTTPEQASEAPESEENNLLRNAAITTGVAGTAAAVKQAIDSSAKKADADDGETLDFLDSFAALDLDDAPAPFSDVEIDDWETPQEMSPAQRLSQAASSETYIPTLSDFERDDEGATDELDDLLDDGLDDLLENDVDPVALEEEKSLEPDELLADDNDDAAIAENEAITESEEASVEFDEFAAISEEDLPEEVLGDLLHEPEEPDGEITAISLGPKSILSESPDTDAEDLDDLLPDTDPVMDMPIEEEGELNDISDVESTEKLNIEATSEAVDLSDINIPEEAAIALESDAEEEESEGSSATIPQDNTMSHEAIALEPQAPPVDELLEAATAVTPEVTEKLLEETLEAPTDTEPEKELETASVQEAEAAQVAAKPIDDEELLNFIGEDWQFHPDVAEISSLDDMPEDGPVLVKPLSEEELEALEDIDEDIDLLSSAIDDDWEPLNIDSSHTQNLESFDLILNEDEQSVVPSGATPNSDAREEVAHSSGLDNWEAVGSIAEVTPNTDSGTATSELSPIDVYLGDLDLGESALDPLPIQEIEDEAIAPETPLVEAEEEEETVEVAAPPTETEEIAIEPESLDDVPEMDEPEAGSEIIDPFATDTQEDISDELVSEAAESLESVSPALSDIEIPEIEAELDIENPIDAIDLEDVAADLETNLPSEAIADLGSEEISASPEALDIPEIDTDLERETKDAGNDINLEDMSADIGINRPSEIADLDLETDTSLAELEAQSAALDEITEFATLSDSQEEEAAIADMDASTLSELSDEAITNLDFTAETISDPFGEVSDDSGIDSDFDPLTSSDLASLDLDDLENDVELGLGEDSLDLSVGSLGELASPSPFGLGDDSIGSVDLEMDPSDAAIAMDIETDPFAALNVGEDDLGTADLENIDLGTIEDPFAVDDEEAASLLDTDLDLENLDLSDDLSLEMSTADLDELSLEDTAQDLGLGDEPMQAIASPDDLELEGLLDIDALESMPDDSDAITAEADLLDSEVLQSLAELDQSTANLDSGNLLDDFGGQNDDDILGEAPIVSPSDNLEEELNLDPLAMADMGGLENELTDSGDWGDLGLDLETTDALSSLQEDSATTTDDSLETPSTDLDWAELNLDIGLDGTLAEAPNTDLNDLEDTPIDLEFDLGGLNADISTSDDGAPLAGMDVETEDWQQLDLDDQASPAGLSTQETGWESLATGAVSETATEKSDDWAIAGLDGLENLNDNDLSGLENFDVEALSAAEESLDNTTTSEDKDWEIGGLDNLENLSDNDLDNLGNFNIDALELSDDDSDFSLFGDDKDDGTDLNPFLDNQNS